MSSAQDGGGRDQVAEVDGQDVVLVIGCSEEWASWAIRTSQHVGLKDVTQVNVLLKEGDGVRAITDAIASIERQLDGGEPIPILGHAPHQYRIGFSEERARQMVDELEELRDALEEGDGEADGAVVATDGGVPVMNGDVVGAEQRDDGTIVATVEFDTAGVPEDLPIMEWLLTGEASLSISSQDGQGPLIPDGGHPPGPRANEVHPDAVHMGTASHKCDVCDRTVDSLEELADHDCGSVSRSGGEER